MLVALDTNTCIDLLKGRSPLLAERFRELKPGQVALPALVYAELLLGVELSARAAQNRLRVEKFVAPLKLLYFDAQSAAAYAAARAALQRAGQMIGPNDLIIAATVISHQALLITANVREFRRVPGLRLEDWTKP